MMTNEKNTWRKNSDERWHIGEHGETQGRAFLKRHSHVCFFSPALNVTCYFFSFRSRLVICDPLTSIDSLHLNSQVKKNNVVFKATD